LVLDVKTGRGAFMRDRTQARKLARALVKVGSRSGKRVVALLTDMSSPLGCAVGNAIETREAIDVLHGGGPPDLVECTMALGAEMLVLGGAARTLRDARGAMQHAIRTGSAAHTMERMIAAQGGNPAVVSDTGVLPRAPERIDVPAPRTGFVRQIDAREIGLAAVSLGAGRSRADQKVDPAVGIEIVKKPGDRVIRGEPLARLHTRGPAPEAATRVLGSFAVGPGRPKLTALILDRIAAT
jgi:thymidine phosphorylase